MDIMRIVMLAMERVIRNDQQNDVNPSSSLKRPATEDYDEENVKRRRVEAPAAAECRCIKHYSSRHQILLVGEGDFSFSACLGKAFGSASKMVATSLDSQGILCMCVCVERERYDFNT